MANLSDSEKKTLLQLARATISAKLLDAPPADCESTPLLENKRGCFVTLHKKKTLRGCIGTIEPVHPLIEGVKSNAINAAFRDPRFPALKKNELNLITIEISVLTIPEPITFTDAEDLKRQLIPGVHGVILSQGWHSATFLPQVWDQLPDKELFLAHLCEKAGMPSNCWCNTQTTVKIYEADHFSEP